MRIVAHTCVNHLKVYDSSKVPGSDIYYTVKGKIFLNDLLAHISPEYRPDYLNPSECSQIADAIGESIQFLLNDGSRLKAVTAQAHDNHLERYIMINIKCKLVGKALLHSPTLEKTYKDWVKLDPKWFKRAVARKIIKHLTVRPFMQKVVRKKPSLKRLTNRKENAIT